MRFKNTVVALVSVSVLIGCAQELEAPQRAVNAEKSIAEQQSQSRQTGCTGNLRAIDEGRLIELSNPNTLVDEYDAQVRVNAIAKIFRESEDPRGLFATVYRLITNRAVESVENGDYAYPTWARSLITEFARRYMANLYGHLTNTEVTGQWTRYYTIAQNCNVGRGRTLGVAIAVHLMVDLPKTLYLIDSQPEQREDFVVFGDILLQVFDQLIIDIERDYKTDVSDLLNGFFFGDWVDRFTSQGTMTAFMYQGIRLKAWRDGQNYRTFPRAVVNAEVRLSWGTVDLMLAHLDAVGVL
ncbi:MAG: hypothetical protein CMH52_14150 [Myxococcales bacterium]|nr:hypothetical protein [Myxococcales bacterium]